MAMTMTGEATLPAARPKVWALLNDPDVLKACIPGCQSLERVGDNGFAAVAKVKIGPVSATFKGKVALSDIVADTGYTLTGEGEGGIAGFARGVAKVSLADAADGTLLSYNVEAHTGGKIAQLGSRLIDGVSKGMADKFFASFAQEAAKSAGPAPIEAPQVESHISHPTAERGSVAEAEAAALARPTPSAPVAPLAAAPAPSAPSGPAAASGAFSPVKKKSWFRRIWEWFMSR